MSSATLTNEVQRIGYIGMGIMGAAMAGNLVKAGFEVMVWNRTASKCQPLADLGAAVAESPADMAAKSLDAICINVTNTPDVDEVLFGQNGIAGSAATGLIVIDNSTISPVETQRFAAELAKKEITFLDAPVSGGDVGAKNGTLSIMVGGDESAFDRCSRMFDVLGKSAVLLGPAGMGQVCKACNQIAVACNLIGVCEALALAKKSGLDMTKMIDVVSGGAASSWQLANLGPKIMEGDHAPGFMIDLVLKDLSLVADAAREHKLPLNAVALAEGYFRAAAAGGAGQLGTQAMAKTIEQLGGFEFAK
ncbi:MAG: 2-hydroxy-3-oxopropionate reductase [Phycisphaeraceae bacterium]|nr:2-hydroxy-3-oxopropionate reductase [Phycisphaeraceae bacterium]